METSKSENAREEKTSEEIRRVGKKINEEKRKDEREGKDSKR